MASSDENNEEPSVVVVADGNDNDENGEGSQNLTQGYTIGETVESLREILVLMASPLIDEQGSAKSVVAGLATIVFVGTCLGLAAPVNEVLSPAYRRISAALGYIYFMAWSVSFYPQVISNFKRKSTAGLSVDFCVLNVIGFAFYTAYSATLYWSPTIQQLYKERYGPDAEITVQSNDVAFAIHALVLSLVTLFQIIYYNSQNRTFSNTEVSDPILVVIAGIAIVCVGYPVLIVAGHVLRIGKLNLLDYLYLLSYIKIFISLIKYMPQVVLNFRRKSTVGWSIWNILLDLTGGILSDLQLVLDCADLNDFSGITHNKVKLALGSLSIVFDLIFIVQHYLLYSTTTPTDEQLEPLLPPTEDGASNEEEGAPSEEASSSSQPVTVFV